MDSLPHAPIGRLSFHRIDPVTFSLGGDGSTQRGQIRSLVPSRLSFSACISSWTAHHACEYGCKVPSTRSRSRLGSGAAGAGFATRRFAT
ncbi:hypothetical protein ABIG06_001206 [Bradyrhizobium sp. USDA 326]